VRRHLRILEIILITTQQLYQVTRDSMEQLVNFKEIVLQITQSIRSMKLQFSYVEKQGLTRINLNSLLCLIFRR